MPTATAPLGKPSAPAAKPAAQAAPAAGDASAAKPAAASTGFTKPAGLSRQTAPKDKEAADAEDEEESAGLQPIHLGVSIVALLIAALFLYTAYFKADQTPNRVSDYLFSAPAAADDSGTTFSSSSNDDDDDSDSSSSQDSGDDDEDEEEEDDE